MAACTYSFTDTAGVFTGPIDATDMKAYLVEHGVAQWGIQRESRFIAETKPESKTEMKEWLVSKIDEAIINAPTVAEEEISAHLNAMTRKEASAGFEKRHAAASGKVFEKYVKDLEGTVDGDKEFLTEKYGYVTFEIPNGIKYRILNTKRSLDDFRKKILASSGFREGKGHVTKVSRDSQSSAQTVINQFVKDEEYDNAYYAAREAGIKLGFIDGSQGVVLHVDIAPVDVLDGRPMFVGRFFDTEGRSNWQVTDETTGKHVGEYSFYGTKDAAIKGAKQRISEWVEKIGIEGLNKKFSEKATGETQEQLEEKFKQQHGIIDPVKHSIAESTSVDVFSSPREATTHLVKRFGPGINNLVNQGILNFSHGKENWPEGSRSDSEAVYADRKAFIDLDVVPRDRMIAVALHEIGEHYNLKRMLGMKAYTALIQQISRQAEIKGSLANKTWQEVAQKYENEGSEDFVSEVVAKLGEKSPNLPWYRRLVIQVKAFLMKMGLAKGFLVKTLNEDDMHDLLIASLHSAARDTREVSFFPEALKHSIDSTEREPEQAILFSRYGLSEEFLDNTKEIGTEVLYSAEKYLDSFKALKLAFLSVQQIAEQAKKIVPMAKDYENAMRLRRTVIDSILRAADVVTDKWRKIAKEPKAILNKVIRDSTRSDVDASKEWSVIEEGLVTFLVYTQAKLSPRNRAKLTKAAKALNTVSDEYYNNAVFKEKSDAEAFLEQVHKVEAAQTKFRQTKKDENRDRKLIHEKAKAVYDAMPEESQSIYVETNKKHNELSKMKLAALEKRIEDSIIDAKKRQAAIAMMRKFYETNSLQWYYAPLARFGRHWFYGVDKDGEAWFKAFESTRARDRFVAQFVKDGGKAVNDGTTVKELQELKLNGVSDAAILDINKLVADSVTDAAVAEKLQDDIYQMYLEYLPDVSLRHQSQHRKGVLGEEEDALRSFAHTIHHSASQIANMTEGRAMEQVLKDINESIAATNEQHRATLEDEIEAATWLLDNIDEEPTEEIAKTVHALRSRFRDLKNEDIEEGLSRLLDRDNRILKNSKLLDTTEKREEAANVLRELTLAYDNTVDVSSSEMDLAASRLRQAVFIYMLGFSLSGGLINTFQTPVVAMPVVIGKYGYKETAVHFKSALADFTSAVKMLNHRNANGDFDFRDRDGNASITAILDKRLDTTPRNTAEWQRVLDELKMLEYFKNSGEIGRTQTHDIIGIGREGDQYGGRLHEISKKAGWLQHHGERMNREITLLAAYRVSRKAGIDHDSAIQYAREVNNNAHGDYSPENAARIFRGWPAGIALQFGKYPQAMYYLYGKNLKAVALEYAARLKKMPEGVEREALKTEAAEALQTLGALIVMQIAVGGVLGLPLIGALSVLASVLAPDDDDIPFDLKREIRVGLKNIGGEQFSKALSKGLLNLTPADVGSRVSIADIRFRDLKSDLEGADEASAILVSLFGPTGGLTQRLFESGKYFKDGEYVRAAEQFVPKVGSDIIKAGRFLTEDARSVKGNKLKDMSPVEVLVQAFGFSSSDLELRYAERGYEKTAETSIIDAHTKLVNTAVRAKMEHEPIPTDEIKDWNARHPHYKITTKAIGLALRNAKKRETRQGEKGYEIAKKVRKDFDYELTE